MSKIIKSTYLYYIEGTSDKVYEVFIQEETPSTFRVFAEYGRRGNVTNVADKGIFSLTKAESEYNKLVVSKLRKGYKEDSLRTS